MDTGGEVDSEDQAELIKDEDAVDTEPQTPSAVDGTSSEGQDDASQEGSRDDEYAEALNDETLLNALEIPEEAESESKVTTITSLEIEQLKNDLTTIQLQARLEIEAMKSRMEELEQELEETQRTDANAGLETQQETIAELEQKIITEEEIFQQVETQVASIEADDPVANGPENLPVAELRSANESLMSILRLRLIETITLLKAELSAADDSDTQEMDMIKSEIEKLESTFEEIESIAAEELEKEKSKVEQLQARLENASSADSSGVSVNDEIKPDQVPRQDVKTKGSVNDECKIFPNLCKHFGRD